MEYPIKDGTINVRFMRHTDVEQLIQLVQASFADEYLALGSSSDKLAQQIRNLARGRMIPFKILKTINGFTWEQLVAEENGKIIGCTGYSGKKQLEFMNLMVHPDHRRRGIAETLLKHNLDIVTNQQYPSVTASILSTNTASLNTFAKHNFQPFDKFTSLEVDLPVESKVDSSLQARPIDPADESIFRQMEKEAMGAQTIKLAGSSRGRYIISWTNKLAIRFNNSISNRWIFEKDNVPVGFLAVFTNAYRTKGNIARPITTNPAYIPSMVTVATDWLTSLGKTGTQLTLSTTQTEVIEQLQADGWNIQQSWVRVYREL